MSGSADNLFAANGVHTVVDGQFGSTGKGLLAAWLAEQSLRVTRGFEASLYSGGPNSGHTFYHGGEKHVLKQLPTFGVARYLFGYPTPVYLTAGAIIDQDILAEEAKRYPGIQIFVHPNAAVVTPADKDAELHSSIAAVAGTRSGAGAALARKVYRDPDAVWGVGRKSAPNGFTGEYKAGSQLWVHRIFMEVSQGFSLGINSQFYPKVTSRECTVMQGLADARIAPTYATRTYLSMRTMPIRVGNVDGHSSGEHYPDQDELDWANIGVEPELTTVTKRQRRIFSFSHMQAKDAIAANMPTHVFMNFKNYLSDEAWANLMEELRKYYGGTLLYGTGPHNKDVHYG